MAARGGGVAVVFAELESDRFEDKLRAALDERHPGASFAIAVGTACRAIGDYGASDAAARHALDVMRTAGRAGETFSFRDESFETLLLQATEPARAPAFRRAVCRPPRPCRRRPLDRASPHAGDVLRLRQEPGEQTAPALHVHVSTLRYRLARACEAAGVEPKDEQAMLGLQLALAVAATLGGAGPTAA